MPTINAVNPNLLTAPTQAGLNQQKIEAQADHDRVEKNRITAQDNLTRKQDQQQQVTFERQKSEQEQAVSKTEEQSAQTATEQRTRIERNNQELEARNRALNERRVGNRINIVA
jgi:DNA-binding helix-hairpin-helix protein with protein kinase domain